MKPPSLCSPRYCILLCYSICISILFYALIPLLTQYTIVDLKFSLAVAGILSGLFSVVSLAARPFAGYLSDSQNPVLLFFVSTVGLGISILLVTLAKSVFMLFILRALQGTLYAFSSTSCFVLLNRQIPLSRLNEGIGYYGMGQILSSSLGMSLGIFLIDYFKIRLCYLFLGTTLICISTAHYMFFAISIKEDDKNAQDNMRSSSDHLVQDQPAHHNLFFSSLIPLLPLGLTGALFSISNGVETTFLTLLGRERGISHLSLFFTFYVLILIISKPGTGRLSDRFGLKAVLYPALALMAIESFLIGTALSIAPLIVAAILKALGQGSAHPSLQSECIRRLGYKKSGIASSIFLLFTDIGQGMGPMIVGCIADFVSFKVVFSGIGLIYLFSLMFFILIFKV